MISHNIANVDGFGESTRTAYRLLLYADTPAGLLLLLPKFIKALETDKGHKAAYNKVKEKLLQEDQILQNHKHELVNWMIDRLKLLRKLKCSKFSGVKKTIDYAQAILSGQTYEISSGG